jgi:hypothetical protein
VVGKAKARTKATAGVSTPLNMTALVGDLNQEQRRRQEKMSFPQVFRFFLHRIAICDIVVFEPIYCRLQY